MCRIIYTFKTNTYLFLPNYSILSNHPPPPTLTLTKSEHDPSLTSFSSSKVRNRRAKSWFSPKENEYTHCMLEGYLPA